MGFIVVTTDSLLPSTVGFNLMVVNPEVVNRVEDSFVAVNEEHYNAELYTASSTH